MTARDLWAATRDAIDNLDRQGRVHEIVGREERLSEIAREYRREPHGTQVISKATACSSLLRRTTSGTSCCIAMLSGHEACVVNADWTLDRRFVLSCDSDGGLRASFVAQGLPIEGE